MGDRFRTFLVSALLIAACAVATMGTAACSASSDAADQPGAARAVPDYRLYGYGVREEDQVIDFAFLPTWSTSSLVAQCLLHDRILRNRLAASGWSLRGHGFIDAKAMQPYLDGRLDMVTMGDIAALTAVLAKGARLCAAPRQGQNALIFRQAAPLGRIKGMRVGFPAATVGHFTVSQALASVGLSESDIRPVQMAYMDMAAALSAGQVDAVATNNQFDVLERVPGSGVAYRSPSLAYLVVDRNFADRHGELLDAVLAGIARAAAWARKSDANILRALEWMRRADIAFRGVSDIEVDTVRGAHLAAETVHSPAFPMLPPDMTAPGSLARQQFGFLQKAGLAPAGSSWEILADGFSFDALPLVIGNGAAWEIGRFDYED